MIAKEVNCSYVIGDYIKKLKLSCTAGECKLA